jgi:hypothetical protein
MDTHILVRKLHAIAQNEGTEYESKAIETTFLCRFFMWQVHYGWILLLKSRKDKWRSIWI